MFFLPLSYSKSESSFKEVKQMDEKNFIFIPQIHNRKSNLINYVIKYP